ncbi:MAG: hypothetical protein B7Z07_00840 [Sphingomonadales bacterium 32-67-7]|nr:MAG: hypothetical protein B7Z07_00840 [Sphingomonadales bacterium 32-67-7]
MSEIADRLAAAGIRLPTPLVPKAEYLPWTISGSHLYISGQVSLNEDVSFTGTVGADVDLDTAIQAARLCGINLLAQMNAALEGDLERVVRIVKLGGFVQCAGDFSQIPQVINGASSLMAEIFGERGRHARSSVGVYRLPRNVAVEIDAVVEVA